MSWGELSVLEQNNLRMECLAASEFGVITLNFNAVNFF